jgi:anti-sigma regulatory factor (Ser/Thr protein kinase)
MTVTVGGEQAKASLRLPALPSSVGAARRLVRDTLPKTMAFEDLVEAAELVMSEAVTNAVVHTGTTIDVTVQFAGNEARLDVRDGSGHPPTPRDYAATAGTGRGLMLIDELTTSWGTRPHSDGKTVWFLLDGHGSEAELDNAAPPVLPRLRFK